MMLARFTVFAFATLLAAGTAHAQCTNCTISNVGGDTVLTFTVNGTFTPPATTTSVRYLVVGGGAGGGGVPAAGNIGGAGGGGAGGYLAGTGFAVTPLTVYNITVGAGGASGVGGTSQGGNGGNSVFSTLTAIGGGGGASAAVSNAGEDGGSGGGGRITGNPGGNGVGGQGNDGGDGNNAAGGGGGAGGNGANGGGAAGGAGGVGTANNITGANVTYAEGGDGGDYGTRAAGAAGAANSGDGGEGAAGANGGGAFNGGAGGSGIVIVRYTPPLTYYSRVAPAGNWGTGGSWSTAGCGGASAAQVPIAGAQVVICAGDTITLNANSASLASLTIQNTGTLNIGNSGTARTLTVAGDLDNAGTLRYNNNTGDHDIVVNGQFTNSGTFTHFNNTSGGQRSLTVAGLIDNSGTFRFAGRANAGEIMTVNANGGILNSGTFDVDNGSNNTHALNVAGNLVNNGTFDLATDANSLANATFNGAAAQSISGTSGSSNFNNLTLDNANGLALSGTQSIFVNTTLTLTNGRLTTNANVVHITSANAVAGAGATAFVVGNLRRAYPTGTQTRVFEVGTEAGGVRYAPVSVQLATITGAGNFTVSSTAGDHPNIGTSTLDAALSVNRYWTLNNDSVTYGGNATVAFDYVGADVDGGADFNEFYVGRYNAPNWTEITPSARAATSTTIDGIAAAAISGAYQIAERSQTLTLLSATIVCGATTQVEVLFSQPVTAGTATNSANYALDGGAGVTGAVLDAAGQIVTLTVTGLNASQLYTLTVNNIQAAPAGPVIAPNSQATFFSDGGNLSGLLGSYYANMTLAGSPAGTRIDGPVDFDWGNGTPGVAGIGADNFSVRWTGFVTPTVTGNYTFRTRSDDGIRLYLDGALIIDNWTDHAPTNNDSAPVALTAGQRYSVVMEFYENGGGAVAQLSWNGPGTGGFQFIPRANLSHACGLPRPVAFYALDESAWAAPGDVTDSSGNGLNGTSFGGATPVPAQVCNGAQLDGTARYLEVAHDARLNMTGSFAVTAWINANALAAALKTIVSKDENYEFHLTNAGEINWWWEDSGGTTQTFTTTGAAIVPGNWYHVAVVYEPGNQVIYIDGVSRGTATFAGGLFTNTDELQIGADHGAAGRQFDGRIDEVRLYDQALSAAQVAEAMNATRPCLVTLDHYNISHAGSGVACDTHQITITAHDASHNPVDAGARTVTLSTSNNRGTWTGIAAGGGALSDPTAGDGAATYTFAVASNAVILNFRYANLAATSETFEFGANDGTFSEDTGTAAGTEDPSLTLAQAGFRFNNVTDGNTTIPTQLSGKPSNTGWNAKTLRIQAIQTDTATGSCAGLFASQTRSVDLGAECNLPGACAARQVSVNGGNIATGNDNGGTGAAGYSSVSLNFNASSEADTVIAYPDAGQVSLHARFDLDPDVAGFEGIGASNPFVVRPFGLAFPGVPHSNSAAGSLIGAAGDNFAMTLQANQWAVGEDANNDGVPDTGVNITDNGTVPNFAATASVAVQPGGNLPGVANGAISRGVGCAGAASIALAGGSASAADWCYSETGNVIFTASVANYLAAGTVAGSSALDGDVNGGYVGRFKPKAFAVTGGATLTHRSAPPGCAPASTFTYLGEELTLGFTLEARNTQNVLTQNYTGAYAKLDLTTAAALGLGARDGATNLTPRIDSALAPAGGFTNGVASLTVRTAVGRAAPDDPDGPFAATQFGIAPNDADPDLAGGVQMGGFNLDVDGAGGNDHAAVGPTGALRYGRLVIGNAYGPEQLPLPMPIQVQYWDGGAFAANALDSCTRLAAADIGLSAYTGALAAGESVVAEATIDFAAGIGTLTMSAPGAGNSGSVLLTPDLAAAGRTYLRGRWSGAAWNENPAARAAFGLYGQPRNFIFFRENY
jgi:MSHA biogenesis protein MshQ